MTDEMHPQLSDVEMTNAMRNIAHLASGFFDALVEEGFKPEAALLLTTTWLSATVAASKPS